MCHSISCCLVQSWKRFLIHFISYQLKQSWQLGGIWEIHTGKKSWTLANLVGEEVVVVVKSPDLKGQALENGRKYGNSMREWATTSPIFTWTSMLIHVMIFSIHVIILVIHFIINVKCLVTTNLFTILFMLCKIY